MLRVRRAFWRNDAVMLCVTLEEERIRSVIVRRIRQQGFRRVVEAVQDLFRPTPGKPEHERFHPGRRSDLDRVRPLIV